MRLTIKHLLLVVFTLLVSVNVYVFVHGLDLSNEINLFEKDIGKLHQENLILENKIYQVDSLQHAASLAAQLDFTQKAEPVYLESLKYAKSQ